MATNKNKAKPALKPTDAKHDPNALEVPQEPKETKADAKARKVIMPSVTGAVTMQAFKNNFGKVDLLSSQKYRRQMDARRMSERGQDSCPGLEADC